MNPPCFSSYQERRQKVYAAMLAQGGGVALIATGKEQIRNRDCHFPFRADSGFYYLTGFEEPEAILVLVATPDQKPSCELFCLPKDFEREIWDGYRLGPEQAPHVLMVDRAQSIQAFEASIDKILKNQRALWLPLGKSSSLETQVKCSLEKNKLNNRAGERTVETIFDLAALLDELRLIKDDHEISLMQQAADISAQAHCVAMQQCKVDMHEYELEALLLYEFRKAGASGPAYNSIVATGANSTVLHYRASNAKLKANDFCLIDAACEFQYYASDITRTFPVSGQFSQAQAAFYEVVLAAQLAAIDAVKVGASFTSPHQAALSVLVDGMLSLKLLDPNKVGQAEDVIANGAYRQFFMHRTSHWLGMDVHDVGAYAIMDKHNQLQPRTLAANMVLTIEPGLYVRPHADVPEKYWNFGVRIEDDVLVTTHGAEVLTKGVGKTIQEIEILMRKS